MRLFAGQSSPSELCKGRRRTKPPKYLNDYESDEKNIRKIVQQEAQRRGPKEEESNSQTRTDDEEEEEERKKKILKSRAKKPKKVGRPRKHPVKEENANGGTCRAVGGRDAAAAQPENGTPKPKRSYVRKQQRNVDPPPDPPAEEPPSEAGEEPREEPEPGGRRRRGAAKAWVQLGTYKKIQSFRAVMGNFMFESLLCSME